VRIIDFLDRVQTQIAPRLITGVDFDFLVEALSDKVLGGILVCCCCSLNVTVAIVGVGARVEPFYIEEWVIVRSVQILKKLVKVVFDDSSVIKRIHLHLALPTTATLFINGVSAPDLTTFDPCLIHSARIVHFSRKVVFQGKS